MIHVGYFTHNQHTQPSFSLSVVILQRLRGLEAEGLDSFTVIFCHLWASSDCWPKAPTTSTIIHVTVSVKLFKMQSTMMGYCFFFNSCLYFFKI